MSRRPSPTLIAAVLVLVLAAGGVGYAAGKVTSADIQDNTIQSKDIKDGTIAAKDLDGKSVNRSKLDRSCKTGEYKLFGGCVSKKSSGPSSHQAAIDNCNRRDGRLPTTQEILWIASHTAEFDWADGNVSQYEFTGDYTSGAVYTPIAFDRAGNAVSNASGQLFWHHCVTS